MTKVDIGELKELIEKNPDITLTLALASRLILNTSVNLGDYVTFIVAGIDDVTPEIVVSKKELRRFAKDVLEKTA